MSLRPGPDLAFGFTQGCRLVAQVLRLGAERDQDHQRDRREENRHTW